MSIKYYYANNEYNSESEAQNAVTALSVCLQNNPTNWIGAKVITGSNETGWLIDSTLLTDAEILTPDVSKTYTCHSKFTGENVIPVSAVELAAKCDEYRKPYAQYLKADLILKVEDTGDGRPTVTPITTTTDMSEYL
tara:strand:+ start:2240 stop:2650 length:411 start_codon:yes stop_codon:yes gene_type:complete